MGRHAHAIVVVCVAACGRIGFDPLGGNGLDAQLADGPPCQQAIHPIGAVPQVLWTGNEFVAAWSTGTTASFTNHFAHIDTAGRLYGDVVVDRPQTDWLVHLTHEPGGYAMVWFTFETLMHGFVDSNGTIIGTPVEIRDVSARNTSTYIYAHELPHPSGAVVMWSDERIAGRVQMFMSVLDIDGHRLGSDIQIGDSGAATEILMGAQYNAGEYAIAYLHDNAPGYALFVGRRDSSGLHIGSDRMIIANGVQGTNYRTLQWDGTSYFATVAVGTTVHVEVLDAQLSSTGSWTPASVTNPSSIAEGMLTPTAPNTSVLVWSVAPNPGFSTGHIARLDATGTVVGSVVDLVRPNLAVGTMTVAAAASSGEVLAAWSETDGTGSAAAYYQMLCP